MCPPGEFSPLSRSRPVVGALSEGHQQGPPTAARVYRRGRHDHLPDRDAANDIAEFLASRRAKITPEQVGLPSYGKRRCRASSRGNRVPGRRQRRLLPAPGARPGQRCLRARARGVGPGAAAQRRRACASLRLGTRRESARADAPRPPKTRIRPVVQRLLDQIEAPAIVSTVYGDYLAANALGRALYAPVFDSREQPANSGRFTFLDPAARDFYPDWERLASELVAALRLQAGRNPYDRSLQDLIGELSTRSEEFRVRWAAHNVRFHRTGHKRLYPDRRRAGAQLRDADARRRRRPAPGALHRRSRLGLPAGTRPAGQLDGDTGPDRDPSPQRRGQLHGGH